MTRQSKILVINGSSYFSPFKKFGAYEGNSRILDYNPEAVRMAVFTGGSDVDPVFYGEKKSVLTFSSLKRDTEEEFLFNKLAALKIPLFGICRGSQFLCVMAGGKLCQHLNNHGGMNHEVLTNDKRCIIFNSFHHQMMLPGDVPHILLAEATPRLSTTYVGSADKKINVPHEYEAVYFNGINAVGVQYHPEMMDQDSEGYEYCVELTEKLLDGELAGK